MCVSVVFETLTIRKWELNDESKMRGRSNEPRKTAANHWATNSLYNQWPFTSRIPKHWFTLTTWAPSHHHPYGARVMYSYMIDKYLGDWTWKFYIISLTLICYYTYRFKNLRIWDLPLFSGRILLKQTFPNLSENVFDFSPNWNNISLYFNYQYFSYWLLKPYSHTKK